MLIDQVVSSARLEISSTRISMVVSAVTKASMSSLMMEVVLLFVFPALAAVAPPFACILRSIHRIPRHMDWTLRTSSSQISSLLLTCSSSRSMLDVPSQMSRHKF